MDSKKIVLDHEFLGTLFDYFSIGCIVLSPDLKIRSLNQSAELITGKAGAEILGRFCSQSFDDTFCEAECRFRSPNASPQTESGPPVQTLKSRHLTKMVSPILGPKAILNGYIEVFQDNSVLMELFERVRHDDRRLKIILDNLDIGVLTVDCGGHVTFFNTKAEKITGFSRGEVLGKSSGQLFGAKFNDSLSKMIETNTEEKSGFSDDVDIRTREERIIPVQATYFPLKNEENRLVGGLATLTDLSLLYQFHSAIQNRYSFYDMVGKDPVMQNIFETASVVGPTDATVLIEGPTGTGKDVLAKVIHNAGNRADKPLIKINCAALPDNLLESELFGYVKGAFTGAERDKPGRFQDADGGTLFLDEIGDLPLALQAKLLHVLEEKEFYPLGSRKTVKVDVRIISATNQNLQRQVELNKFRQDLYYRLNVMRFELPPLKDRKSDISLLISHILKRLTVTRESPVEKISEDVMHTLMNYEYPGNIRELENILEHALIVCQGDVIERKHLPIALLKYHPRQEIDAAQSEKPPESEPEAAGETDRILSALKRHNWNKTATARALNINRSTLWRKMKKLNISG